jgi:quercetin dioxygenase-like cupin family protein
MLHFLEGEAEVTLGEEKYEVGEGAWAHMRARLPHSVRAKTEVKMLLLLSQGG